MGLNFLCSNDSYPTQNKVVEVTVYKDRNPDPSNWRIRRYEHIDGFLIVDIQYPNCTNYEGRKILLYEEMTIKELKAQKLIDPHFSENEDYRSPIARFEPTRYGWVLAKKLIESLEQ